MKQNTIGKQELLNKAKNVGAYSIIFRIIRTSDKETYTEKEAKQIFAKAGIGSLYK